MTGAVSEGAACRAGPVRVALRRIAVAAFLLLLGLEAGPAAAAPAMPTAPADRLCALTPRAAPLTPYPAEDRLRQVTDAAERGLAALRARGEGSEADRVSLDIPAETAVRPSDAALAGYCAAAGEAARLGAHGSQAQAIVYLLVAYRLAAAGSMDALAMRSAYRLGLVGTSGSGASGTRGAGTPTEAETDGPAQAEPTPGQFACAELASLRLGAMTVRSVSLLGLECAADRARRLGDGRIAGLSALRLSLAEHAMAEERGQDGEALRASARARLLDALSPALSLPPGEERAELVGRLVEAALAQGAAAEPAVADAVRRLRAETTPDSEAVVAALEGRLALARGDPARARERLRAAILAESRRAVPARLPNDYLLLASAEPARRAAHIAAAYDALDNLRPLLPRFDSLTEETSFALYMRDVFVAAAEAELGDASAASEPLRIRHAQEIVEAYRQAELQSAFGSECLPPRGVARLEDLRPGETLLYPLLLPNRIELLYVAGGDGAGGAGGAPTYRRLPPVMTGRAEISRLVEEAVRAMSEGRGDWRPAARRLYDLLIAPVADRLGPGTTLAIVPDGPLRALPFAALVAPDGRFLVQQTRLSLIPALAYAQPSGDRNGHDLRIVAASLQRQESLPVGFFPALGGTAEEARVAAGFAREGRLLPDFTRADLEAALDGGRIDVLHLATHAVFNGRSDRAFIVANGEVVRLSELREMIDRSRVRGEPLDLIVLSACETAVGDEESSMGLAGAAVQAGARSVIGSLWQVDDAGTSLLMREFYRRYSEGEPRAEALQGAQRALIEGGGENADPAIWAAFALLGAWR